MISCVYCGGVHERPADIRRCWAEREGAEHPSSGAGGSDGPPADSSGPQSVRSGRHAARSSPAAPLHGSVVAESAERTVVALRRGPQSLGRHVIVGPGQPAPPEWEGTVRLVVDPSGDTGAALDQLRIAAARGAGLVLELATDFDQPPETVDARAPYELGVGHQFALDHLHHLVWSNAIDARDQAAPGWELVDRAVALGARVAGRGDVVLPDGTEVWLDGGPVRHRDPADGVVVVHSVAVEHGSLEPPRPNRLATDLELAPDQAEAVLHRTGSARIIAPAGSGKTRVLTERARQVIDRWRVPPSAVCLVAFNKRAQEEMRERTADLPGLQVRTLNSIALAILNGAAPFAPQPRSRRTIDEPEVRRVLQRFVATPKRRNTDPFAPWIEALSLVRLGLVDPLEVEARYDGDVSGLPEVFERYEAALDRDAAVDFDGQIDRALRVLLTDAAARRAARHVCRVLLVDEFQDLTPAHLLLVRLLAGPGGVVFGVGDDDQTIYGYNGADPGWLIDFERWFPGAGDHPLEVNYRCPAGVVEVADRLLRHNRRRVAKVIRAASTVEPGWSIDQGVDTVAASAAAVARALAEGRAPSEIAVLARVNAVLAPVQVALVEARVPVTGGVGVEFAERTAVRAALAWLRLASGAGFSASDLDEALRRPSRALHPRVADWVGEQRDVDGLLRLADRLTNERDAARVAEFAGDLGRLQAMFAGQAPTGRLVDALVGDVGLGGAVATLDRNRRGMNRGAQGDDLLALRQLAELHPDAASFEGWLRSTLSAQRSRDGVTLATVHRVKGQEWPTVVVHLAAADQFPHRLADDTEEERRLFHVAITRASRSVTIVAGTDPSPFVHELTTEPSAVRPAPEPPPRVPARAVREGSDHPLLDRGRVMAVEGLVLVDHGHQWTIVALEPESAVARCGDATRRFPIGAKVETLGRQRGSLAPRSGGVEPASVVAFDLLRAMRDRARNGKPAYTVFDDKTLAAIATGLPGSLDQLAKVKGVGPAKLEQYGDAVLGVVADAVGT